MPIRRLYLSYPRLLADQVAGLTSAHYFSESLFYFPADTTILACWLSTPFSLRGNAQTEEKAWQARRKIQPSLDLAKTEGRSISWKSAPVFDKHGYYHELNRLLLRNSLTPFIVPERPYYDQIWAAAAIQATNPGLEILLSENCGKIGAKPPRQLISSIAC